LISNFSAYKINVPKTITKIPKYSIFLSVSFNTIYEKKELNIGVNDKRGMVKLKSERTKDFKNMIAEITLIKTKIKPGIKYDFSILKFSSKKTQEKKNINCTIMNKINKTFGLTYLRDNFLVTSNNAQKKPFKIQINIVISNEFLLVVFYFLNLFSYKTYEVSN
jgi:preprotein translocase subunit SecA